MFDQLNTFWGGVVSLAGGLLVLFSLFKAVVSRPRRIAYDFRSNHIALPILPNGFEISYNYDGQSFPSIHKTEVIIKNETEAPLIDGSFLSVPIIHAGESKICVARKIDGIDDSRAEIKITKGGEVQITDLMIPIDSSLTVEIVSVAPIDQVLRCVHKDAKTIKRNYGWWPRSKDFLISGPFLVILPTLLVYFIASLAFGDESINGYFVFLIDSFGSLGIPKLISGLLAFFHVSLIVFISAYIFQLILRPTSAEKRFTKLKIG
jgi:hypothetical protein